MLKNLFVSVLTLFSLVSFNSIEAMSNYDEIYPPIKQYLTSQAVFQGDRHGDFQGDLAAILEDGSAWKIHPECRETFKTWKQGDVIHVKVRTDWYWFKREHKFMLYNHTTGESVKAMLVRHITNPYALTIVSVDSYAKSQHLVSYPEQVTKIKSDGRIVTETVIHQKWEPCDFRKVLLLSDNSCWVIKEDFANFQVGQRVFVGANGKPGVMYDFVLISGDEREATWTWARPQK